MNTLNPCENCYLNLSDNRISPTGSRDAKVYIIYSYPRSIADPSVQSSLDYIFNSMGIDKNDRREMSVYRCRTDSYSPLKEVDNIIDNCSKFLLSDIKKSSPEVILGMGEKATEFILNQIGGDYLSVEHSHGKLIEGNETFNNTPIIVTHSPKGHGDNDLDNSYASEIMKDVKKVKLYLQGEDIETDSDKKLVLIKNYEEFNSYYKEYLEDKNIITFDLESNFRHALNEDAKVIGFSMAGSDKVGGYIVIESLEYEMPEEDVRKIEDDLKEFLPKKKLIVHNSLFERPFLKNWLDLEVENLEDTMMQSRLLLGGSSGAGLKHQATQNLGYDDWGRDLSLYREHLQEVYKNMKMTYAGNPRHSYKVLKDSMDLRDPLENLNEKGQDNLNNRQEKLRKAMNNLISVIAKYYKSDDLDRIMEVLSEKLIERISKDLGKSGSPKSYGWIPLRIITEYGALDSIAPYELYFYNKKKLKEESDRLGINLQKGYEYWMQHAYAGYRLELNGANWDEDVVHKEVKHILKKANDSLRNLILSPLVRYTEIYRTEKKKFVKYLKKEKYGDVVEDLGSKVSKIKDSGNIVILGDKFKWESPELLKKHLDEDLFWDYYDEFLEQHVDKHYNEGVFKLKSVMNPRSTRAEFREVVSDCIITDQIRIAKFYSDLNLLTTANDFEVEDYRANDQRFLKFFIRINEDEEMEQDKKMELFIKKLDNTQFMSNNLQKMFGKALRLSLESLAEPDFLEVYELYKLLGYDVEDESTWDDNFRWLFNFRLFKKTMKMWSSYIKGKPGRGSVRIVDEEDFRSGKDFVPRKRTFYENRELNERLGRDRDFLEEGETHMYQPDFSVCSAETGRWRSGFHCLTGDTKIKLLDGRDATIDTIMKERDEGKEHYIYSVDNKGNFIVEKMKNLILSGYTDTIAKITLDNGEVIKSTPDHRFMKRDGSYIEAQDIKTNESMMPGYFRNGGHDGRHLEIYQPNKGDYDKVHGLSYQYNKRNNLERDLSQDELGRNDSWCIHHFDFDKTNNRPTNVNRVGWITHTKLHQSTEAREKQWEVKKQKMEEDEDYREQMLSRMRKSGKKSMNKLWNSDDFRERHANRNKLRGYFSARNLFIEYYKENPEEKIVVNKEMYEKLKPESSNGYWNWSTIKKKVDNLEEVIYQEILESVYNNHKVESVEIIELEEEIPVYDLVIGEETPCFLLSAGIVSHNTIPWSAPPKRFFTSRFKGGTIAMPDFSQMEVRTLAASAGAENMLEAYRNGLDAHTYNTSLIYGIPMEEVTEVKRRYCKMVTFSILYGSTPYSMAETYLNGDTARAEDIYNKFYNAYPAIKKWIEDKHREYEEDGRVTLFTDRYININPRGFGKGAENRAKRQAQNYPIQGGASDIAGCVIDRASRFIQNNGYLSKPFGFVHDSIEVDFHPNEMLELSIKMIELMNEYPDEEFGIPAKADLVIGYSVGEEIEVEDIEVNDDFTEGTLVLNGWGEEIDRLINPKDGWSSVFNLVEKEVLEEEEKRIPMSELFVTKRAFTKYAGKTRYQQKAKIKVKV